MDMHSAGIIHGDIKPANILVFKDPNNNYIPRVIDFGYSTRLANANERIEVPKSGFWTAPERGSWNHSFAEAKRMDAYSFGMLCLWFIFYAGQDDGEYRFGNSLWIGYQPLSLACNMLSTDKTLHERQKENLEELFKLTLTRSRFERSSDFGKFLNLLAPNNTRHSPSAGILPKFSSEKFQINKSMHQLCRAPYEVRDYIVTCLIMKASSCSSAALELALCYRLGFGVDKDAVRSGLLLNRYGVDPKCIEAKVDQLKLGERHQYQYGIFSELLSQGHITAIQLVQHYRERDRLSRAEWRYRKEVKDMEEELGSENDFVIILKSAVSMIIADQGRWREAETLVGAVEAKELRKHSQNDTSSAITTSLTDLALTFGHQGLWEKAEAMQSRALALSQEQYGAESPRTYTARAKLAFILLQQSKWEKAETELTAAVAFMKRTYGEEHPITTTTMTNLAAALEGQGRREDAEKLFDHILKVNEKILGPEHPNTVMARHNFSSTYWDLAMWDQAEALPSSIAEANARILDQLKSDKESFTKLETGSGLEHPIAFVAGINIAITHQIQGEWVEAEELQNRIIATSTKLFGDKHRITFKCKANLVSIYRALGRDREARELSSGLVKAMKEALGEHDRATLAATHDLFAMMMTNSDELEKVVVLLENHQETCLRLLGQNDAITLAVMANLGLAYQRQGNSELAENLITSVLQMRRYSLGHEHPHTISSMDNVAAIHFALGRLEEAEREFGETMNMSKRILGETHPDTLRYASNFALARWRRNQWARAEWVSKQVIGARKKILGENHSSTLANIKDLALRYREQGRLREAEEMERSVVDVGRGNDQQAELQQTPETGTGEVVWTSI